VQGIETEGVPTKLASWGAPKVSDPGIEAQAPPGAPPSPSRALLLTGVDTSGSVQPLQRGR
jgi:hypothetical protein